MVTRCSMAYPCLWNLVMCGNTFKHNWNGFCWSKKYFNINIVYEHTYFSTFISDAYVNKACLEYILCICIVFPWIIIRQNYLGRFIFSIFAYNRLTWIETAIVKQVLLKKNLKFYYKRENVHTHIAAQKIILKVLPKLNFAWQCKYGNLS